MINLTGKGKLPVVVPRRNRPTQDLPYLRNAHSTCQSSASMGRRGRFCGAVLIEPKGSGTDGRECRLWGDLKFRTRPRVFLPSLTWNISADKMES
jgi:hypothetical protein